MQMVWLHSGLDCVQTRVISQGLLGVRGTSKAEPGTEVKIPLHFSRLANLSPWRTSVL